MTSSIFPTSSPVLVRTRLRRIVVPSHNLRLCMMPERIQTARLVLSPVYAPRSPESRDAPRIVAYTASNTVTVRLEDLSLVGPVIDSGLKAGANQLDGVQFALRNELPTRQQA